ncbi:MAG: hypothetical protein R3F31_19140 [Verrucomicrobiales bacterium]
MPEMVRAGVLIEPLVESGVEVLAFFAGDATLRKRPAEVWLETENGRNAEWSESVSFTWERSAPLSNLPCRECPFFRKP